MKIDSELLRQLRAEKNWSQEQLAEQSGLSLRTIQRLENGGNASIESVRALADAFDIDHRLLLIQENRSMTPFDAVKNGLLRFTDFTGTATRYEYWWFLLFVVFMLAIATIIHEKAYQLVAVILLLPLLAAGTRRLNESGHSGWWQLLLFVPFGQVVVFYMMTLRKGSLAG